MSEFSDLKYQLQEFQKAIQELPEEGKIKVLEAQDVATKYHEGQKRKNGDVYILHPVRVALILILEAGQKNADSICAALLHDVIEDTAISADEIKDKFGANILNLVENLSIKQKEPFADYMRRIYESGEETIIIKFCDRLDNARDTLNVAKSEPEFVESQIKKITKYFLPYAHKNPPYFEKQLLYNVREAKKILDYVKHSG